MHVALTWYDNAAFKVVCNKMTLWFDPSINKNPDSPIKTADLKEQADFVFTTHGDPGHFVNSIEVAQRTGALFLAPEALSRSVLEQGQMDKERVISLRFGENRISEDVDVFVFEAEHPEQSAETLRVMAQWGHLITKNAGFVIRIGDIRLCHMGDTIYSDAFQRIGHQFAIDIGTIPIQGKKHGDPSIEEAVESGVRIIQALKPKLLFPVIQYTKHHNRVEPLKKRLAELQIQTRTLFDKPGTEHTFTT